MNKKRIILIIALLAVGLTVVSVPQVQAQSFTAQEQQLINDYTAGRITLEQFGERLGIYYQGEAAAGRIGPAQMEQRMMAVMMNEAVMSKLMSDTREESARQDAEWERQQQAEAAQRQKEQQQRLEQQQREEQEKLLFPGETRGWPTAAMFQEWSLSSVRQPSGGNTSYTFYSGYSLEIWVTGTNASILQGLKQQLVSALGKLSPGQTIRDEANGWSFSEDDGRRATHRRIWLRMESNTIRLTLSWGAA